MTDVDDLAGIDPSIVKIHRSVMLAAEGAGTASLDELVAGASGAGLTVVVEGVETASMARTAAATGADLAQGFYFARPHPARVALASQIDWRVWTPG